MRTPEFPSKFLYNLTKAALALSLLLLGIYEIPPALPGSLAEFKGTAAVAWTGIILRNKYPYDKIFTL